MRDVTVTLTVKSIQEVIKAFALTGTGIHACREILNGCRVFSGTEVLTRRDILRQNQILIVCRGFQGCMSRLSGKIPAQADPAEKCVVGAIACGYLSGKSPFWSPGDDVDGSSHGIAAVHR